MKTYQHFASVLTQLLRNETAVRITVNGCMPLSVEAIGQSAEGNRLISICHHGKQNGDLMRDPDMAFKIHAWAAAPTAEPLSFRNDWSPGKILDGAIRSLDYRCNFDYSCDTMVRQQVAKKEARQ